MINHINNEKHLVSSLLLKLATNYQIKIPYINLFSSIYLLKNFNFNTKNVVDKSYYSTNGKIFKLTNEENLSKALNMNAFQLFGLENKFLINKKNLDSNYKKLIKQLHPDVNSIKNENISIHIIKQYNIVNDPFERALLLASMRSKMSRDNLLNIMDTIPMNSSLFEQILEINDKISEITKIDFSMKDFDEITRKNKLKINDCIKSLESEFEKDNVSIIKILSILKELRIYQKLCDRVSSIIDN